MDTIDIDNEPLFRGALRFGFSNIGALVVWGVLSLILVGIIVAFMLLERSSRISNPTLIFLGLLLLLCLGLTALLFSYSVGCARALLEGESGAPDIFRDPVRLVEDGIRIVPILLEFAIAIIIVMIPYFLVEFGALPLGQLIDGGSLYLFFTLMLLLLTGIAVFLITMIFRLQLVVYAATGRVLDGMNPIYAIMIMKIDVPFTLWILVLAFLIQVVFRIISLVTTITVYTALLAPFTLMPSLAASTYIVMRLFRHNALGSNDDDNNVTDKPDNLQRSL